VIHKCDMTHSSYVATMHSGKTSTDNSENNRFMEQARSLYKYMCVDMYIHLHIYICVCVCVCIYT